MRLKWILLLLVLLFLFHLLFAQAKTDHTRSRQRNNTRTAPPPQIETHNRTANATLNQYINNNTHHAANSTRNNTSSIIPSKNTTSISFVSSIPRFKNNTQQQPDLNTTLATIDSELLENTRSNSTTIEDKDEDKDEDSSYSADPDDSTAATDTPVADDQTITAIIVSTSTATNVTEPEDNNADTADKDSETKTNADEDDKNDETIVGSNANATASNTDVVSTQLTPLPPSRVVNTTLQTNVIDHDYDITLLVVGNQLLTHHHLLDVLLPSLYLSANLTFKIDTAIQEDYSLFAIDRASQLKTHVNRAETLALIENHMYDYILLQDNLLHPFFPATYEDALITNTVQLHNKTCSKTRVLWMETWLPCMDETKWEACYVDPEEPKNDDARYDPKESSYAEITTFVQSYYNDALKLLQQRQEDGEYEGVDTTLFDVAPVGDAFALLSLQTKEVVLTLDHLYEYPDSADLSLHGSYLVAAVIFAVTTNISPVNAPVPPIRLPVNKTHEMKLNKQSPTSVAASSTVIDADLPFSIDLMSRDVSQLQLTAAEAVKEWRAVQKQDVELQIKKKEEWIQLSVIAPLPVSPPPPAKHEEPKKDQRSSPSNPQSKTEIEPRSDVTQRAPDPPVEDPWDDPPQTVPTEPPTASNPASSQTPSTSQQEPPQAEPVRDITDEPDSPTQEDLLLSANPESTSSGTWGFPQWPSSVAVNPVPLFWLAGLVVVLMIIYYIGRWMQNRRAQALLRRRRGYDDADLSAFDMEKAASATYQFDDGL